MLAACGIPIPKHMDGVPLFDQTGNISIEPNKYAFAGRDRMDEAEDTSRTVRDARYRYIRHFHPDRPSMMHTRYPDRLATWDEFRRLHSEEAKQIGCGQVPNVLSPLQRSLLAVPRPAEELYDLQADPHETRNLAHDPQHLAQLVRLRQALEKWQQRHGDLGLIPESQLINTWRPGGKAPAVAEPLVAETPDGLIAECETPGSSIAWTTDPPTKEFSSEPLDVLGTPPRDERRWHLYTAPLTPPPTKSWFKAFRLGYEASKDVLLPSGRLTATRPSCDHPAGTLSST